MRNLEFDITEQNVKDLLDTTKMCPLRKVEFERGHDGRAIDNSCSLDRTDSSKGYINGNIQLISYRANVIKSDLTLDKFRKIVANFESFEPVEHAVDNKTCMVILEDRANQIIAGNREKDKLRLMNIERGLINSSKKKS